MKLASRLHSGSLTRCQRETGARQFVKWLKFFQEEDIAEIERTEKWEHYATRLFALILKVTGNKNVSEKDLLIKFKVEQKRIPVEKPVTKESRIKEAKAFWGAFFAAHKAVVPTVGKKGK